VDQQTLQKCQELVGYHFKDLDLLKLALTHASVAPTRLESNERLEFLGDAVLGLTVCHELYVRCRKLAEGEMTKVKSLVVSRQTCATVAEEMGIPDLLATSKGLATRGGAGSGLPLSVSAAVFEAIIGAIYVDGGPDPAEEFVLRHMRPHIAEALRDEHRRNYKSALQQQAQREFGMAPEYLLLDEKGPDHRRCFEVAVRVDGRQFPSAWGISKKQAEQKAARLALVELGVLNE
jgi:ribonuclease-3